MQEYLEIAFLGFGGGFLVSGVAWLLGLTYSACYSIIFKQRG